ncbi:ABC transporter substrate-binding protein [Marivita sp. XM-24bin2]|jgi:alpha-glucoside transport system substrate-binding protein|uniref:ABC transporter substrate-binding protein n=1 Tax=unclassified Marivita TaxID=2632480 RepID=UPI000D79F901|nr:ABC transporter substrate-binding protein [Marivita sp. XM-24bin2]MCR9108602.1 ABC transporter substrate-binding protein [Paracoccaceae bacterium]PWL36103.1 MAG: alpha-glucoside ABC transporter substrate-binding protein [Marivita sp. XM-24bin2]
MTYTFRTALFCSSAILAASLACAASADSHLRFPIGEGPFDWAEFQAFADSHDFSGQTLDIAGAGTGRDADLLREIFAYFAEATGAEVKYSGSDSYEQDIVIAVQAGTPPDVALFPQPGLAADLAKQGHLVPLADGARQWYIDNFAAGESWADLASPTGPDGKPHVYGIFNAVDVKSLVWYSPEAFDENGYDIPESMEELKTLTDTMVDDGLTPFCLGLGAGAGTGWPATDWVEDFMLRTQPPEVYDQWVSNEIPFTDPRVVGAIEEYGYFARNDDYVDGGSSAAATIDFRDSPDGLFEFPPKCMMHRQASFIPTFFPDGIVIGEDADFFYFPAYESKDLGRPVLGSGGLATIMQDKPIAHAFLAFLQTSLPHALTAAQGKTLTPHTGVSLDAYANDTGRALAEILLSATTFRFDGSDLMPGEIGTDAFWNAMVEYTTGSLTADEAAATIQARWDSIR